MVDIVSVQPESPWTQPARTLFTAYREFLETIESTHCFDFARYREEIAALPAPYSAANGELLLAVIDGETAACIAYRHAAAEPETTCEIKRLFVQPTHRKQGLARLLIGQSMQRASVRGFTRAILDTDIVSMPAAYATYCAFGFTEYIPGQRPNPPSLRFMERKL